MRHPLGSVSESMAFHVFLGLYTEDSCTVWSLPEILSNPLPRSEILHTHFLGKNV
jgi:hypothetical protein